MLQTNVKLKKLLGGTFAIVSLVLTNVVLTGCGGSETEKPDTKSPQEDIYKNQSNDSDEDKEEKKDKEDKQQVRNDDDDERGGDKQKNRQIGRKKDRKQDND